MEPDKIYVFVAIMTIDGKPVVTKKVLSDCETRDYAVQLGVAMCSPYDTIVIHCEKATIVGLAMMYHELEAKLNHEVFEAVTQTKHELTVLFNSKRKKGRSC